MVRVCTAREPVPHVVAAGNKQIVRLDRRPLQHHKKSIRFAPGIQFIPRRRFQIRQRIDSTRPILAGPSLFAVRTKTVSAPAQPPPSRSSAIVRGGTCQISFRLNFSIRRSLMRQWGGVPALLPVLIEYRSVERIRAGAAGNIDRRAGRESRTCVEVGSFQLELAHGIGRRNKTDSPSGTSKRDELPVRRRLVPRQCNALS